MLNTIARTDSPLACALVLACSLATVGCGTFEEGGPPVGRVVGSGETGLVAGEDGLSRRIAMEVLAREGTAADAAVAYFFMAAVSYPSRVSLASGGLCLSYEEAENQTRLLDFRNRPVATQGAGLPIPGAVRGMSALQAVHGKLAWHDLLVPAERAARFGVQVSPALASDLAHASGILLGDTEARRLFASPAGDVPGVGDTLVQFELSDMLSGIRTRGASDFYRGRTARSIMEAAHEAGRVITPEEFGAYAVAWSDPATFAFERGLIASDLAVEVPDGTIDAGASTLTALALLGDAGSLDRDAERYHLLAEVALRLTVARGSGGTANLMESYSAARATDPAALPGSPVQLDESPHATGVVTADRMGNAVACVFTLNGLFGDGSVLPGTGIVVPASSGTDETLLPVIVVNDALRSVVLAGTATGGSASPVLMAQILTDVLDDGLSLDDAVGRPRVHHRGLPHVVFAEGEAGEALAERGHVVEGVSEIGRVLAIHCPDGLRNAPDSCMAVTDPRVPD